MIRVQFGERKRDKDLRPNIPIKIPKMYCYENSA